MCGIAGIVTTGGRPAEASEVEVLINAMAHRGRDHWGVTAGGRSGGPLHPGVALGHRRLAIIDLSPAAAQPMRSTDGQLWISYNGEIYNFESLRAQLQTHGATFRTGSDTEVILEAYRMWGEACVTRLSGMFAFAIWDDGRRRLFCARDAMGIKPLYYTQEPGRFCFASESQALAGVAGPPSLDGKALTAYLLCSYVPGSMSVFRGVHKLPPASTLTVDADGTVRTDVFWTPPRVASVRPTMAEAGDGMLTCLDDAVGRQLRSDVPVGALLSGGFDSGMVVASAARRGGLLHTYSAGFDDGRQVDERPTARALATRYGTTHHARVITSAEVPVLLERALGSLSEPVADSAIVPTFGLSEMAAADGVKVLLSGTGGDEVFGGYTRYVGHTASRRVLLTAPARLRRAAGHFVPGVTGARLRHRSLDMVLNTAGSARLAAATLPSKDAFVTYLDDLAANVLPVEQPGTPPLYAHMQCDLQVYLPDLLLLVLDQLTMAHTIEGRVPLLDTALVTASLQLPPEYHATASATKRLMRRMAVDRVAPQTLTAAKQGFSGPVRQWIADHRTWFRDRSMAVRAVPGCEALPLESLWASESRTDDPRWPMEVFLTAALSTWYDARVR